jgi:hypothetical protein
MADSFKHTAVLFSSHKTNTYRRKHSEIIFKKVFDVRFIPSVASIRPTQSTRVGGPMGLGGGVGT